MFSGTNLNIYPVSPYDSSALHVEVQLMMKTSSNKQSDKRHSIRKQIFSRQIFS